MSILRVQAWFGRGVVQPRPSTTAVTSLAELPAAASIRPPWASGGDAARAGAALLIDAPLTPVGALEARGLNGTLALYRVEDVQPPMQVLAKPVEQGGAHEVFAHEVAAAFGMDYMLPVTARRNGGGAVIEVVSGDTVRDLGMRSGEQLEQALVDAMVRHGHAPEAAARSARQSMQRMHAFDLVIGNRDRVSTNLMFDPVSGRLTLIDHGKLGSFRSGVPTYQSPFVHADDVRRLARDGRRQELVLDDDVRAMLRDADVGRIERAFARLVRDTESSSDIGHNAVRPDDVLLDTIRGRIESGARDGVLEFVA